jgi:YfiH family protein
MENVTKMQEKINNGDIEYFRFSDDEFAGTTHGFFTRKGGVSPSPWSSLNCGGDLGDHVGNIIENQNRIFSTVNRPVGSSYDVWQVHGTDVIFTTEPRKPDENHKKADAIFTDSPDVTLLMRFADCVPILVYHKERRIVGIIHAGWQGTINQVASKAIRKACEHYGVRSEDMVAGIGPSIGPDHYEVGREVQSHARSVFGDMTDKCFSINNNKVFMDLWTANEILLMNAGIEKIKIMRICTACDTQSWFSHRAEIGKTGRFAGVIALGG